VFRRHTGGGVSLSKLRRRTGLFISGLEAGNEFSLEATLGKATALKLGLEVDDLEGRPGGHRDGWDEVAAKQAQARQQSSKPNEALGWTL